MAEKMIFRIVNRNSEGVTIAAYTSKVLIPWDEFNSIYEVSDDRLSCWLTDEAQARMDQVDEILNDIATDMIMMEHAGAVQKASFLMRLPRLHEKLQELLGCSGAEALELTRRRYHAVKKALAGNFKPSAALKTSKPKPQPLNLNHGERLADNEVLKRLKEEME